MGLIGEGKGPWSSVIHSKVEVRQVGNCRSKKLCACVVLVVVESRWTGDGACRKSGMLVATMHL